MFLHIIIDTCLTLFEAYEVPVEMVIIKYLLVEANCVTTLKRVDLFLMCAQIGRFL